jgi:Flp pilus assembly protein TadD
MKSSVGLCDSRPSQAILLAFSLIGTGLFGDGLTQDFIGTAECKECHQPQFDSYLKTTHSRSFSVFEVGEEPTTQKFVHEASAMRFDVSLKDDRLHHRGALLAEDGTEIQSFETAIGYAVGSGTHAKTYLFESDGFLCESPLSWFRDNPTGWSLSPGYDYPEHQAFRRVASSGCVYCHVGRIDPLLGHPHQFKIIEAAIGCERCHGPGKNHVLFHRNSAQLELSDSIVNPKKLDRNRAEAICQQCHLQGAVSIADADKSPWDFVPGESLVTYRSDYQCQQDGSPMQIVGHVEQMHQSACYQSSETLTCTTCHDPHHATPDEDPVAYYRKACLSCHEDKSCGIDLKVRMDQNQNHCSECHMPVAETNVAHAAFHDHRIGIHANVRSNQVEKLSNAIVPIVSDYELPDSERKRRKALAMYALFERRSSKVDLELFQSVSTYQLFSLRQSNNNHPTISVSLASDAQRQGQSDVAWDLVNSAIKNSTTPTLASTAAYRQRAEIAFAKNDFKAAAADYQIVLDYSLEPADFYYHGICHQNLGNFDQATHSLLKASELDPNLSAGHFALASIYDKLGKKDLADEHAKKAFLIEQLYERKMKRRSSATTVGTENETPK